MKFGDFTKIKSLQTPAGFRENLDRLGLAMPCDDVVAGGPDSPLGAPIPHVRQAQIKVFTKSLDCFEYSATVEQ